MRKVTCSVEGNLGILENDIYDSQLEIEWLINEESHIKDPDSLHEVEQRTVEITNKLAARILALKIQESLNRNEIRGEEKKVIRSVPKKMKNQGVREVNISSNYSAQRKRPFSETMKTAFPAFYAVALGIKGFPRKASLIASKIFFEFLRAVEI